VEIHSDCKNVTMMEKITKNVKTSTMFTEIEPSIKKNIEIIGSGIRSVLSVYRLKIPVVHVFLRLFGFLLQSIPSTGLLITCQGE
jgi:hypothetical protein